VDAAALVPQAYRIAAVRRELADTVTLELKPANGTRPPFSPGQFNMLYAFGIGEIAISISADSPAGDTFVHTVRSVGAVSSAIAALGTGATVGVRGPFGNGWPLEAATGADVLFIAGGLGIAPLRPAIHRVLASRARYGRVVVLLGSRHPSDLLYRHELGRWREHLDVDIDVTVDHADGDWRGNVGVVPSLIPHAAFDPASCVAMVCGPEVMMRFTVAALREAGVPPQRVHLSMERNMKCAVGMCGHCQFGPDFICREGPVMRLDHIARIFALHEV